MSEAFDNSNNTRGLKPVSLKTKLWSINLPFAEKLIINAESFNSYVLGLYPYSANMTEVRRPFFPSHPGLLRISDRWVFYRCLFPALRIEKTGEIVKTALPLHRTHKATGLVTFDGDVWLPVLADAKDNYTTWMSLAPNEVFTQRPGLTIASGRVCIGGLGLGWLAHEVLRKQNVSKVTVVELDPEIANFFSQKIPNYGKELNVVVDDIYKHLHSNIINYDTILLDIWKYLDDSPEDHRLKKLRRDNKRKKIWAWGDNWS